MDISSPVRFGQNVYKPSRTRIIQEEVQLAARKQTGAASQQEAGISRELKHQHQAFGDTKLFTVRVNGKQVVFTGQDFLSLLEHEIIIVTPRKTAYHDYYGHAVSDTSRDQAISATLSILTDRLTAGHPELVKIVPTKYVLLKKLLHEPLDLSRELEKNFRQALDLGLIDHSEKPLGSDYAYHSISLSQTGENLINNRDNQ